MTKISLALFHLTALSASLDIVWLCSISPYHIVFIVVSHLFHRLVHVRPSDTSLGPKQSSNLQCLKLIQLLGAITNYCLCVFTEYHNSLLCGLPETGVTVCFGKRALCMPSRAVPSQSLLTSLRFTYKMFCLEHF